MVQRRKPPGSKANAPVRHQVRIIGGQWKRSVLPVAPVPDLRPTPDRVRETLFNWLTHLSGGNWASLNCLDLFAGTGALGFEAASRGAGTVTLVEMNAQACSQLEAVRQKLKADNVEVVRQNAHLFVQNKIRMQQQYDVIFLDPPFDSQALAEILPACASMLRKGGWVYVEMRQLRQESGLLDELSGDAMWTIVREDRAGQVRYALLQLN